ncbi:unnamed protein product [Bemisia tabaci]|uniref:Ionotropic receptor n=1 Tax=Bemisia tabaci TaxID=7038 RepID=A0A9P0A4X3_BEMTA|nr:unnamed protein product [Bemisia tabaci]
MSKRFQLILPLIIQITSAVCFCADPWTNLEESREPLTSMAFIACQKVVIESQQTLIYIVEFDSDPSFLRLVQLLHSVSIQTITISHRSEMTKSVITNSGINMIFGLNNIGEVLSLIFYSISRQDQSEVKAERFERDESTPGRKLPHFCVQVDDYNLGSEGWQKCDERVTLPSESLEPHSILSENVYNATRGLAINKIWNSKNYLIFVLKNVGRNYSGSTWKSLPRVSRRTTSNNKTRVNSERDLFDDLIFCFKFFWRFFKGQRVVICYRDGCLRYDPFLETVLIQDGETDEYFFDFSWSNMHGKPFVPNINGIGSHMLNFVTPLWPNWVFLFDAILQHFADSVNCTLKFLSADDTVDLVAGYKLDLGRGLQFGVDLSNLGIGLNIEEGTDYSNYDFSVGIESSSLCLATPHSGFMSQGLVIFKSFTPIVWSLVIITFASFGFMQYHFHYSQCEFFTRLYSETEIDHFRGTSSLLTVFAYLVCGMPPSLHLGRLMTGKIHFVIFSFSAIILSTAFLSSMTTLLSNRVPYSEIDTLKTLEDSDLFIQVLDHREAYQSVLDRVDQYEILKTKISNTIFTETLLVYNELPKNESMYFDWMSGKFPLSFVVEHGGFGQIAENIRSMSISDAFMVSVPSPSTGDQRVLIIQDIIEETHDYHLVKECIITFPLTYAFLKNSFFFDKFNRYIAQFLETGLATGILRTNTKKLVPEVHNTIRTGLEPRAYDLNDLQSAFIGLIIGLFLSSLAFIGELTIEYFQNSLAVKCVKRLKMCLIALISRS